MTRRRFDPREWDTQHAELDPVARELERYADLTSGEQPHGMVDRVMASIASEPTPRRRLLGALFGPFGAGSGAPRYLLVGATMALGILAVVLAGQIAGLIPDEQIGPSPSPSLIELPSPSLSPSVIPTPTEEPSRSPRATESPRPSDSESPRPTASDEDDDRETPEPSDDDNSGPGGGGDDDDDDNSGPGGGGGNDDDDSSGPGGGD